MKKEEILNASRKEHQNKDLEVTQVEWGLWCVVCFLCYLL